MFTCRKQSFCRKSPEIKKSVVIAANAGAVAVDVAYVVHMAVALVVASDAACLADVWCFCCCLCCVCRC